MRPSSGTGAASGASAASGGGLVSVIVPTMNEAENLPPLMERVDAAFAGRPYEVVIVDDASRDETPSVCAKLSERYPLRLIVREAPTGGLSGAVLHGMQLARGDTLVVMDADLQHPPESVPDLLAALDAGGEFAIGSRYVPGGSTGEKWGLFRHLNSRVATWLARPFAGKTSDPMSGFFALRRDTYQRGRRLTPLGYKIALELMCKCRVADVREVPIHFSTRTRGESKLTIKQQFKYLEHLSRLYDFCFPRASPIVKFLIAGSIEWCVGLAVYAALVAAGTAYAAAAVVAYAAVILATVVFQVRYVRTQRAFLATRRPWLEFMLIAAAEWVACAGAAAWIAHRAQHPHPAEIALLSFGCAFVARYVLRKELLQDIRGLRTLPRDQELLRAPEAEVAARAE